MRECLEHIYKKVLDILTENLMRIFLVYVRANDAQNLVQMHVT